MSARIINDGGFTTEEIREIPFIESLSNHIVINATSTNLYIVVTNRNIPECIEYTTNTNATFHIFVRRDINKEDASLWNTDNKTELIRMNTTTNDFISIQELLQDLLNTFKNLQKFHDSISQIQTLSTNKIITDIHSFQNRIIIRRKDNLSFQTNEEDWQHLLTTNTDGLVLNVNRFKARAPRGSGSVPIARNEYYIWIVEDSGPDSTSQQLDEAHRITRDWKKYPNETIVYYDQIIKSETNMNECLDDGIDSLNYLEQATRTSEGEGEEEQVNIHKALRLLSESCKELKLNDSRNLTNFLLSKK